MAAKHGPNVKKLISLKMAAMIVPHGAPQPMLGAMAVLADKELLLDVARAATEEIMAWIQAVKNAKENNSFGGDEEAIAGAILAEINASRTIG